MRIKLGLGDRVRLPCGTEGVFNYWQSDGRALVRTKAGWRHPKPEQIKRLLSAEWLRAKRRMAG